MTVEPIRSATSHKRTAVLVVHGIGSQRALETVRGVIKGVWLDGENPYDAGQADLDAIRNGRRRYRSDGDDDQRGAGLEGPAVSSTSTSCIGLT